MSTEAKQRAVSYGELADLGAAFESYVEGVVFTSEEAKSEALSEYTTGFMNYPEEAGGVDEYVEATTPYFAPGIVKAGEDVPQLRQAYRLALKALSMIEAAYTPAGLALRRSDTKAEKTLLEIRNAVYAAKEIRDTVGAKLKQKGGAL